MTCNFHDIAIRKSLLLQIGHRRGAQYVRCDFKGEFCYSSRFSKYGGHPSQIDRLAKTTHKDIASSISDMGTEFFDDALWIGDDRLFDESLCLGLREGDFSSLKIDLVNLERKHLAYTLASLQDHFSN